MGCGAKLAGESCGGGVGECVEYSQIAHCCHTASSPPLLYARVCYKPHLPVLPIAALVVPAILLAFLACGCVGAGAGNVEFLVLVPVVEHIRGNTQSNASEGVQSPRCDVSAPARRSSVAGGAHGPSSTA